LFDRWLLTNAHTTKPTPVATNITQTDLKDTVVVIDVDDPYDPSRPNSYEEYKEEKAEQEFLST
jgi:hypothetical protein